MPPEYVLDCQNAIVPLGAGRNDNGGFHASGSAVLISRQIALTAKHVLVDYHQKAEYGEPLSGGQHVEVHFSIELGSGFGGGTWRDSVDWCATADGHDIALLRLRGTSGDFPAYPEIDVVPPRIGEPAAGATSPSRRSHRRRCLPRRALPRRVSASPLQVAREARPRLDRRVFREARNTSAGLRFRALYRRPPRMPYRCTSRRGGDLKWWS